MAPNAYNVKLLGEDKNKVKVGQKICRMSVTILLEWR
jgi:hypothetical protein